MDKELKAKIADYFDANELVGLIGTKTEDVIDAFSDEVEEALDDLLDIMGVRNERE